MKQLGSDIDYEFVYALLVDIELHPSSQWTERCITARFALKRLFFSRRNAIAVAHRLRRKLDTCSGTSVNAQDET
jgi:hypothetical protein